MFLARVESGKSMTVMHGVSRIIPHNSTRDLVLMILALFESSQCITSNMLPRSLLHARIGSGMGLDVLRPTPGAAFVIEALRDQGT